ncbi:MAG: DUF4139 domain-containing protein [Mesorhizobium sp.]
MRLLTLILLGATAMTSAQSHAAELVLKRAVLGTGGVGYFEYAAEVEGDETLTLRARLDQVDDILKSVLILDPAGSGSATLPGKAGADEAFASLPFSRGDLDSIPTLMSALKGAVIKVSAPRQIEGRIASVQSESIVGKDGASTTRTRVSVLAGLSIEQFILEEAQGLEFADPRLGEQVATALEAVRAAQDRSGRDISIRLAKGGKREVRIGYVAEAPVWKAAYRVTLPQGAEKEARLQGWVVLENMTGNPWKDVAVTLSSASPVTFRQSLYDPYYVSRSVVAPPVSQSAMPRRDQGQMAFSEMAAAPMPAAQRLRKSMAMSPNAAGAMGYEQDAASADFEGAPPSAGEENMAGASFTLSMPVSVGAGESLTIPFVDVKTPSDAVAWYQGSGRNPWQALTISNNGQTSLPPGSATIYELTSAGPLFSGEAQFPLLPAGDDRLLGFGGDQKVLVDRDERSASSITGVRAVDGTLRITSKLRQTTVYRVRNGSGATRKMVVEHPRMRDWSLIEPKAEDAKISGQAYRLRFDVEAGKTLEYPVVIERPEAETIAVADLTSDRIAALVSSPSIDAETKSKLETIAAAARNHDEANAAVYRLEEQRRTVIEDQQRLRDNLTAAPAGSDLASLYAQKMLGQEKLFDELGARIESAKAAVETARAALAEKVRAL